MADKVKGDDTWLPFPGLLTVTPANAGTAKTAKNDNVREEIVRFFIDCP